MAIATLAYKITADTRGLTSGVSASRRELNLAKRVMQETEAPADRLRASLASLEKIHGKGLITSKQYADAQAKVKQEILGTNKQLETTPGRLGKVADSFMRLRPLLSTAAFGFISIFKAVSSVQRTFEELDKLAKTAAVIGIDVNALRALQHAAELSGISTVQLDAALGRMVKRLGLATQGAGPAAKTLEQFGINAAELSKLAPEEQFAVLAVKVNELATQNERVAATTKLFGDDARNMVSVLELGAAGFARAQAETTKFLGTIDPDKIEEFNDNMNRLKLTSEGFRGGVAEETASLLGPASEFLAERGISGRTLGSRAVGALPLAQPFKFFGIVRSMFTDSDKQSEKLSREEQKILSRIEQNTRAVATPPEVGL